jgi:hypothetical protein
MLTPAFSDEDNVFESLRQRVEVESAGFGDEDIGAGLGQEGGGLRRVKVEGEQDGGEFVKRGG